MSENPKIQLNLQALKPNKKQEKHPLNKGKRERNESQVILKKQDSKKNESLSSSSEHQVQEKKNLISIGMIQKYDTTKSQKKSSKHVDTSSKDIKKRNHAIIKLESIQRSHSKHKKSENQDSKVSSSKKQVAEESSKSPHAKSLDSKNTPQNTNSETNTENKIEFQNYVSDFEKESKNVFKKIRNFRYTPKTNIMFVFWLIGLTVLTIGMLMVFFPEKHSFKIYKASILEITHKNQPKENVVHPSNSVSVSRETDSTSAHENPQVTASLSDNTPPQNNSGEVSREELSQEEQQKELLKKHLLKKYSQ